MGKILEMLGIVAATSNCKQSRFDSQEKENPNIVRARAIVNLGDSVREKIKDTEEHLRVVRLARHLGDGTINFVLPGYDEDGQPNCHHHSFHLDGELREIVLAKLDAKFTEELSRLKQEYWNI